MDATCVFCKICAGEIHAKIEYQDENVVAFRDTHPSAPTHVLVVPRRHIVNLEQAASSDDGVLGQVQIVVGRVTKSLGIDGAYKLVLNGGRFQEVKHLHYHLLAGFDDPDKLV